MEITEEKCTAYFATQYRVLNPTGDFSFVARGDSTFLGDLHRQFNVTSSAFITAYNPFGQSTDDEVNRRNQEQLIAEVSGRWKYLMGLGVDPKRQWPSEPSILILGIDLEDALSFGRKYQQHAIVFATRRGRTNLRACVEEDQALLLHPLERMMQRVEAKFRAAGVPYTKIDPSEERKESSMLQVNFVPQLRSPQQRESQRSAGTHE